MNILYNNIRFNQIIKFCIKLNSDLSILDS